MHRRKPFVILWTAIALVSVSLITLGCAGFNSSSLKTTSGLNVGTITVNVKDYAAGDGSKDDTSALQKMLDQVFALKKKAVIDFQGGEYLLSAPLLLPAGHEITLQNAKFTAAGNFPENGFLLETGRKGKAGNFSNEDLYLDNIVFDSSHRGGGLKLQQFNRAVISCLSFKHFKSIGLHLTGYSHEAIVDTVYFNEYLWDDWAKDKNASPKLNGTAMKVDVPDSHFSKIVVAIARKGIEINGQYNQFENFHVWGCEEQGIHIKSNFISITQGYMDGVKLQIDNPWHVEIANSKFFGNITDPNWSFIVLKPTKSDASINGLKIKESSFQNTEATVKGLVVDNSGGTFNPTGITDTYIYENSFANVTPFASKATKQLTKTNSRQWDFNFGSLLPLGSIQSVNYSFQSDDNNYPVHKIKSINGKNVSIATDKAVSGTVTVEADINAVR